jgi:hypothetical protein
VLPTDRLDRLLPAPSRIYSCSYRPKGAILALRLAEI